MKCIAGQMVYSNMSQRNFVFFNVKFRLLSEEQLDYESSYRTFCAWKASYKLAKNCCIQVESAFSEMDFFCWKMIPFFGICSTCLRCLEVPRQQYCFAHPTNCFKFEKKFNNVFFLYFLSGFKFILSISNTHTVKNLEISLIKF